MKKSFIPKNAFVRVIEKDGRIEVTINADLVKIKDNCDTFAYIDGTSNLIINVDEVHCGDKCIIKKSFTKFANKYSIKKLKK